MFKKIFLCLLVSLALSGCDTVLISQREWNALQAESYSNALKSAKEYLKDDASFCPKGI